MPRAKKQRQLKEKVWKVALYLRLSKEHDKNINSESIENQDKVLKAFLKEWDEPYVLVDTFIDDGISGTTTSDRDDFQRMMQLVYEKRVDCIIVKDVSRLGRNYAETGFLLDQEFVKWDVRFISVSLPFIDTFRYPETLNIAVPIHNVVNDDFARQTSLKIRKVFDQKRADGQFIGAFAPYGYTKDPMNKGHLLIDSEAANVVQYIFHLFVYDGLSKRAIMRKLNELGYLSPTQYKKSKGLKYQRNESVCGGLWNDSAIDEILHNEVYIGTMVQGKYCIKSYKVHECIRVPKQDWYRVAHTHEPIIEEALFHMAQKLLKQDVRQAPTQKQLSILAGYVKCGDCHRAMHRKTSNGNVYYTCRTYEDHKQCSKKSISEKALQQAILCAIQMQLQLVKDMDELLGKVVQKRKTSVKTGLLDRQLKTKEQRLSKLYTALDGLYVDLKTDLITQTEYGRIKQNLSKEIKQLSEAIVNLKQEIAFSNEVNDCMGSMFQQFLTVRNITELNRAIIVSFIDTIFIYEHKEIEIRFKYMDPLYSMVEAAYREI